MNVAYSRGSLEPSLASVQEISIPLLLAAALYAVSVGLLWGGRAPGPASVTLFTGAIAGDCVGIHGIVGMALAIAAGIVPIMLLRRLRRGEPSRR